MIHPLLHILTVNLFLVSASSQVDCLWRSSLKVPKATRPLSDCCSRIREPLVSSEDRDNYRHTLSLKHNHTSIQLYADHLIEARSSSQPPPTTTTRRPFTFKNTPCLDVYINGYFSSLWTMTCFQLRYFVYFQSSPALKFYLFSISEVPYHIFILTGLYARKVLWIPLCYTKRKLITSLLIIWLTVLRSGLLLFRISTVA